MIYLRLVLLTVLLFTLTAEISGQRISTKNSPDVELRSTEAKLKAYFQKAAGLGFSGAVLVARDGKVIARDGYGWADVKRKIPITADTVFDIGSNTKVFTAVAIMQMEERGKLNISDPITKYFQNVPDDKKAITIHHLLTHTAGFEREEFYDESSPAVREILKDREKYVQRILSFPLAFKPGESRGYSNSGFSLLAAIVEKISGESYETYLRENILKTAGMLHTGYVIPKWKNELVARGYNDGDTDYGYPWDTQWSGKIIPWDLLANGGLLSTVDDMYKFILALEGEELLSQKTKEKMFTVYVPEANQAYGFFVNKSGQDAEHPFITHGGDAEPQGWNADFRWYKGDNLIAIVLTNKRIRAGSVRRPAMSHLVDIELFGKVPALPDFSQVDMTKLRRLEGAYKLDTGATFYVKTGEAATGEKKIKPILIISGEGQQAIDLLFSASQLAGLTKLSLDLNDKTKAYVEALGKNDIAAIKSFLPPDFSAEDEVKSWNAFVKQNGELENAEVLGSSPLNQPGVQTFVRLKFQRSGGVYKVTWRDQKLWRQDEDRLQPAITNLLRKSFVEYPLNLPFLPKTENEFATYDLFKNRMVNIGFQSNGKLTVKTKDGDVTAQKIQPQQN